MLFPTVLAFVLANHINALLHVPQDKDASPQQPIENAYFGDMVLNDKQVKAVVEGKPVDAYAGVTDTNIRWKDAVIPYIIDCSLENMPTAIEAITKAMAEWEAKTCIRFVRHTTEEFKLTFFRGTHCWGNVGQVSYSRISVGDGCDYHHVMTHEIGHVVGFYHEQNRMDRDDWVNLHWENIGWFKDAFDKVKGTDDYGVPYDYESIMHYPWNAFSSTGKDTMSPKRPTNGKVPYIELSKDDALQTSRMYNCPKILKQREQARTRRHIDEVKNAEYLDACENKNKNCDAWAREGKCSSNDYVKENCKKACGSPSCKKTVCKNTSPYCDDWAIKLNDCHIPIVKRTCPVSCDIDGCGKFQPCKDYYRDCPIWAKRDCHRQGTRRDCPKSCGVCGGSTTAKPETQPPTKAPSPPPNTEPPTAPPTTKPPPTQPPTTRATLGPITLPPKPKPDPEINRNFLGIGILCIDKYDRCEEWRSWGECKNNQQWMFNNCMLTCKKDYPNAVHCDDKPQTPPGSCANSLGLGVDANGQYKLPDSAFFSPDNLSPGGGWEASASNARLYMVDDHRAKRIGAWCAASHDQAKSADGYVQVDLGSKKRITWIATQGRDRYFERINKYKIAYSNDGRNFQNYQENGKDKLFIGNCDHFSPALNQFKGLEARYIRYIPWNWNYPCVRMELFGC